ncbi:glycine/betaine ABC transporter ATP-binding protein [Pandoraea cepalis]|uniref:Quaternary amine transport ATP-binding protein n=1 Tax=Pandoraea cepalis TaxID=2508294 RepID=A0A5E4T4T5_9BURK|nr:MULTISPECIES: ABC transporter ATP-binding protein [Pandoraea]MDN4575340.1 glycine/betaine ABC transporter ATP-binding protein [Pandoraea cepalis]MDN4579410.1 glycine/betaine ABC transporter ATP-binding protein [Pandoraea cepalis]QBC33081.1 glycine/betaine ABC transporter ATP-binding protein [Pandoraea sp. XY-2]VVD81069.1 glycine/betaine ABC transporter ATP-binding protein [Pandoraea cepalis]
MITLDNLTKHFVQKDGTPMTAVNSVSLDVPPGEICVFLGPSGCGKTTTLKMINRLIKPTSGRVLLNGEDTGNINEIELRRHIGYVIQQIGLFPNMTIEENITVVPRLLGWDKTRCRARATELMAMVALDPKRYLSRYPRELSGGQQQRIGVIRALAADPPVLLMDEPFGAVDPINRESIQNEFLQMQRQLGKTVIMVSHDIDEAIKLADRIAIFRQGRLVQCAQPDALLARPVDEFVASFVGHDRILKRLLLVRAEDAATPQPTVKPQTTLAEAYGMMDELDTRSLVVVDENARALGYVARRDTRHALGACGERVREFKASAVAGDNLRVLLSRMYEHNLASLPVLGDDNQYLGEVTQDSIADYLSSGKSRGNGGGTITVPPPPGAPHVIASVPFGATV